MFPFPFGIAWIGGIRMVRIIGVFGPAFVFAVIVLMHHDTG
jgi:hypothetical protein